MEARCCGTPLQPTQSPSELAKPIGSIHITRKPCRQKQMSKDKGRREHLAVSASPGHEATHPQATGGAAVTWSSPGRGHGSQLGMKGRFQPGRDQGHLLQNLLWQLSTAWAPKPLMSLRSSHTTTDMDRNGGNTCNSDPRSIYCLLWTTADSETIASMPGALL